MPNWREVMDEIRAVSQTGDKHPLDTVRRKYIAEVYKHTGRNVIAYYSGWLHRGGSIDASINDKDKNAFMVNVHKIDKTAGLDLILHTPGGDLAATESIVDYLSQIFGNNIRAIIPQISMSAGTMIALSCKQIMMGKQSNLGPIDPQMGGVACQGILAEFEKAKQDIKDNPHAAHLWQPIIAKYHPTFLGSCQNAIDWSEKLVLDWLARNMCEGNEDLAKKILREFSDHSTNKSHARHISKENCKTIGLSVIDMEDDNTLQDLILTVHHAYMHTFSSSAAVKIVENQTGVAFIEMAPMQNAMPIAFQQQMQPNPQRRPL